MAASGASSPTLAPPGYFTSAPGSIAPTPCPLREQTCFDNSDGSICLAGGATKNQYYVDANKYCKSCNAGSFIRPVA